MEAQGVFPEDVLEEILSRLTVRQLLQLRSISKVWRSIIDKYSFIQKHSQIRYELQKEEGDIPLFCDHYSAYAEEEDPAHFCLVSKNLENGISYLTADLNRDCSEYFAGKPELFNYLFCGGVVNGVVLFRWAAEYFGLWNPAIREFKFIPHPRPNRPENVEEYTNILGLGIDPNCSNFKIIRSIDRVSGQDNGCTRTRIYEIYSLKANSWKLLESPRHHLDLSMNVGVTDGYFNGAYYWAADDYDSETASDPCRFGILSFNFSTEVFKLVDAPPPAWDGRPESEWCLDKCKDFLAFPCHGSFCLPLDHQSQDVSPCTSEVSHGMVIYCYWSQRWLERANVLRQANMSVATIILLPVITRGWDWNSLIVSDMFRVYFHYKNLTKLIEVWMSDTLDDRYCLRFLLLYVFGRQVYDEFHLQKRSKHNFFLNFFDST